MGRLILLCLLLTAAGIFDSISAQDENRAPKWNKDSLGALTTGISEATPVGTVLAKLECIDPEGDPITYGQQSGQVVTVKSDGRVLLEQTLEFDIVETIGYDVAFTCFDYDPLFGFALHKPVVYRATMAVDDANDNPPVFNTPSREGYSFEISEDADLGIVLQPLISISDADRTINAEIAQVYFLCNSPDLKERSEQPETSIATCEKFSLTFSPISEGIYSASISLKAALDFETRPVYSTKMTAIDKGDGTNSLNSTINVQINIKDAQDLDPVFTNPGSTTSVSEGAAQGTVLGLAISARDGDTGDSRPVKLSIISDEKNAFYLGPSLATSTSKVYAANLIVNNTLDREEINGIYHITVKVTELNRTTLEETSATATATYSVTVTDVNDETPEFVQSSYVVNVTEMAAGSESVQITGLRIVCEDKDSPSNAIYRVRIISQTYPDVFSISPDTDFFGAASMFISVDNTAYVDYDVPAYRRQILVLEAKEKDTANPKSSSTTVTILLTDVNDNSPKFLQTVYSVEISEKQDVIPTTVLTLSATDIDSGNNGEVEYVLEQGSSSEFSLHPETGELSLQRSVDYEATNQYVFLVYARDKGQDSRSSQVQVTITIQNYNDEAPVFQQSSYQTSVNEGSLVFLTPIVIQATDTEDDTVRVTYRIASGQNPNNAFDLNADTGELTLRQTLQYEDTIKDANGQPTGRFELVVEASDNSSPDPPQNSTVPVIILLIDQNNYAPVLEPDTYLTNLSELARPGTVVVEIQGTDKDNGDFGRITYRLDSGGFDNFAVDPDSGVVTVNDPQNFDFNQQKAYTVRIKATDGGSPQKSDFATIYVDVTDANNKPPKFSETIYTGTVDEDEDINFIILQVFATDSDSSKDLRYTILQNTIKARDGDGKDLISSEAYDYLNAISINQKTGDVFVNGKLDKETALEIYFQVQVEDVAAESPGQTATTQVSLTVTGKIDDNIIFEVISQNFMNENTPTNFDVATLVATDPINPQDSLRFSKLRGSNSFDVTVSGIIRPNKLLNFEEDPLIHRLVVQALAADGLRSATATVTINILDINDNSPEFDRQIYSETVDEDRAYPTVVTFISARDKDSASYGPIIYRIGGGVSSNDFELFESNNGVFVLVAKGRVLNYNRQSLYQLDIIATDNPNRDVASNQNFNRVKLIIRVIDKNNNVPTFNFQETFRRMAIAETAPVQKSVGTVIATDADFGRNGVISYFLQAIPDEPDSSTGIQLFRMIENVGTVVVAKSLVGLGGKRYPMRVRATDHGDPSNSAFLTIHIQVLSTEIDDGSPLWVVPSEDYLVHIREERANEIVIAANYFEVTPRTGNNVTFSLSPLTTYGNSFVIDSITGEIKTTRSLDRERKETYTLVVYAGDTSDSVNIRSGIQINVDLDDLNDNDATFKNPKNYPQCGEPIEDLVTLYVAENTPANEVVYRLSACDPDGPGNNEIVYQPYSDNDYCKGNYASSAIEIQLDGRLTTKYVIDFEQSQEFVICVQALSVNTSNSRHKRAFDDSQVNFTITNVIYIHVVVRDQNDNGPKFPENSTIAVLNARPSILDTVVWLNAVDPDGDGYNSVRYTITSVIYHESGQSRRVDDLFVVKSRNAITPSRIDYESYLRGYFSMQVLATDDLNPQLKDIQQIKIYVYRPGQSIKVILNFPPSEGYNKAVPLTTDLNQIAATDGYHLIFLQASEHSSGGDVDLTKTDICFLGIDTVGNQMLDKSSLIRLLEGSHYETTLSTAEYDSFDRGACYPSKSSEETIKWRKLWWVLVAVAIFIFVCCLIFIVLVCILYRRYKRYMKSKQMILVPQ